MVHGCRQALWKPAGISKILRLEAEQFGADVSEDKQNTKEMLAKAGVSFC